MKFLNGDPLIPLSQFVSFFARLNIPLPAFSFPLQAPQAPWAAVLAACLAGAAVAWPSPPRPNSMRMAATTEDTGVPGADAVRGCGGGGGGHRDHGTTLLSCSTLKPYQCDDETQRVGRSNPPKQVCTYIIEETSLRQQGGA